MVSKIWYQNMVSKEVGMDRNFFKKSIKRRDDENILEIIKYVTK